jgi:sulfite reductase alpha subunit-like flavoprotein
MLENKIVEATQIWAIIDSRNNNVVDLATNYPNAIQRAGIMNRVFKADILTVKQIGEIKNGVVIATLS